MDEQVSSADESSENPDIWLLRTNRRLIRIVQLERKAKERLKEEADVERERKEQAVNETLTLKRHMHELLSGLRSAATCAEDGLNQIQTAQTFVRDLMNRMGPVDVYNDLAAAFAQGQGLAVEACAPSEPSSSRDMASDSPMDAASSLDSSFDEGLNNYVENLIAGAIENIEGAGMDSSNPPPAKKLLARVNPMVQGVPLRRGRVRLDRIDMSALDDGNRRLIEPSSSSSPDRDESSSQQEVEGDMNGHQEESQNASDAGSSRREVVTSPAVEAVEPTAGPSRRTRRQTRARGSLRKRAAR